MNVNKLEVLSILKKIPQEYYKGERPFANLHIHSEFSDGCLSVGQICQRAINEGKKYIAITDHDTLFHLKETAKFKDYSKSKGLNIIDGVELSTKDKGKTIHLLVYGAKYEDMKLQEFCKKAHLHKSINTRTAVKMLSKDYVVVLAHPIVYSKLFLGRYIKKLKKLGLSGVENFYKYDELGKLLTFNPLLKNNFWSKLAVFRNKIVSIPKIAKKNDLLLTGGTDAHGLDINSSLKYKTRSIIEDYFMELRGL